MLHTIICLGDEQVAAEDTYLAEVLGAFLYALDLTEGQPAKHSLRSCWIASRMAVKLGLTAAERRTVYYTTLLNDLGCSSNATRVAELYQGDDRVLKHGFKTVPLGLRSTLQFVFSNTARGQRLGARAKAIAAILRDGEALMIDLIRARCTRGADIARKLRFACHPQDCVHEQSAVDAAAPSRSRPARQMTLDPLSLLVRLRASAQGKAPSSRHGLSAADRRERLALAAGPYGDGQQDTSGGGLSMSMGCYSRPAGADHASSCLSD